MDFDKITEEIVYGWYDKSKYLKIDNKYLKKLINDISQKLKEISFQSGVETSLNNYQQE